MKIYCVECWSNEMRADPWTGERSHDTHLAHVCTTLEAAQQYCKDNPNYGGTPDATCDYFPWHWVIFERDTEDSDYSNRQPTSEFEKVLDEDGDKCSGCSDCSCEKTTEFDGFTLEEYQDKAKETAVFPKKMGIVYCTLALNGEAGEVAEKVKKVIRDEDGKFTIESKHNIALEVGDVLWYLANLADQLGYTLQEVADMNLLKLASRAKRDKLKGSGDDR